MVGRKGFSNLSKSFVTKDQGAQIFGENILSHRENLFSCLVPITMQTLYLLHLHTQTTYDIT